MVILGCYIKYTSNKDISVICKHYEFIFFTNYIQIIYVVRKRSGLNIEPCGTPQSCYWEFIRLYSIYKDILVSIMQIILSHSYGTPRIQ